MESSTRKRKLATNTKSLKSSLVNTALLGPTILSDKYTSPLSLTSSVLSSPLNCKSIKTTLNHISSPLNCKSIKTTLNQKLQLTSEWLKSTSLKDEDERKYSVSLKSPKFIGLTLTSTQMLVPNLLSSNVTSSLLLTSQPQMLTTRPPDVELKTQLSTKSHESTTKTTKGEKKVTKPAKKAKRVVPICDGEDVLSSVDTYVPEYNIDFDSKWLIPNSEMELIPFVPPQEDSSLHQLRPLSDVILSHKMKLVNAVSGSLICAPNYKDPTNEPRSQLIALATEVIAFDPEFILKLALYTRRELNIRSTANFLLALAASNLACRPYLKKYYSKAICLPSDWIDVAELYQYMGDVTINLGSLPSVLRRAMAVKFLDFDQYQLAKYNKEKSRIKKRKALEMEKSKEATQEEEGGVDEDGDTQEEVSKRTFTLKQLIRKLHLIEPAEYVMSLIGKKYPERFEDFVSSRLTGEFDADRSGKRMKLATPETWETQVSLKGNKAATWETLLDNRKLPYMAMLRNLRNMIQAGISDKHHNTVLWKLADEKAVINSKQFPFRFFSAYEVLDSLQKSYEVNDERLDDEAEHMVSYGQPLPRQQKRIRTRTGVVEWWKKDKGPRQTKEVQFDVALLNRYKKALDTAVRVSTTHNIPPIKGHTVIVCKVSPFLDHPCKFGAGLGSKRTYNDVILLLGLMCKYSCEDCDLIVYNKRTFMTIELNTGTILDNMEAIIEKALTSVHMRNKVCEGGFPAVLLEEYLHNRVQIDNLILAVDEFSPHEGDGLHVSSFLHKYRNLVNPYLLFVCLTLSENRTTFEKHEDSHINDIYLSGFSDQLLRFIAERGSGSQLTHIEKIAERYELPNLDRKSTRVVMKAQKVAPSAGMKMKSRTRVWRTMRVFISSTFRDMHGERDVLTRYVFPELRARAAAMCVNVYEVDLRWGVTEEHTKHSRSAEQCVHELSKCNYFLGMLGERYGWVPEEGSVPQALRDRYVVNKTGCSMTEMEFGWCLTEFNDPNNQMFVYTRDPAFMKDVPKAYRSDFSGENGDSQEKLSQFKKELHNKSLEIYEGYPCEWGGVVDGCPMVSGLDLFGKRVLNNLWQVLVRDYLSEKPEEHKQTNALHQAAFVSLQDNFVGRWPLFRQCYNTLNEMDSGILAIVGKPGMGKSTLMAAVVHDYSKQQKMTVDTDGSDRHKFIIHMVGAAPGSAHITRTLARFLTELNDMFDMNIVIPKEYKNVVAKFWQTLSECSKLSYEPILIILDGVDVMEKDEQPLNLRWIPEHVPEGVVFVITANENGPCHQALRRRQAHQILIPTLEILDKPELVRNILAKHGKELDENAFNQQLRMLLSKREANVPLYLSMACEEIRVFRVYEELGNKLRSLPATLLGLLQEILSRLEADHGGHLVSTALCLIYCSRIGLTQFDLLTLLSVHHHLPNKASMPDSCLSMQDVYKKAEELPLPSSTLNYLFRALHSFLRPATTELERLTIGHNVSRTAIHQRYLKSPSSSPGAAFYHQLLAGYYYRQADVGLNSTWEGRQPQAYSELPYHLKCSSSFGDLETVICDLLFIEIKAVLGFTSELLTDYQPIEGCSRGQQREYEKFISSPRVADYQHFVLHNLHVITKYPILVYQQAHNYTQGSVSEDVTERCNAELYLITLNNKRTTSDPCTLAITDLVKVVTCVSVNADGSMFVCGDADGDARLYQVSTGQEVRSFHGHSDTLTGVCFAGSNRLVTASADKTVCLWDSHAGHRIALMTNHRRPLSCVVSDGQTIASVAWDCMTILWNASDGKLIAELREDCRPLNCAAFHPEGHQIVTGGWDTTLRIWHIPTRKRKAIFRGHSSSVRDVAFSHSGRHIASASLDGDVKLWWALTGHQVCNIRGHSESITSLTYTPDGDHLITASNDHKVKVWSGDLGKQVHCYGSEKDWVATAISFNDEGTEVAVGYHEGQLRVYDIDTGEIRQEGAVHTARVQSLRVVPNSHTLVSVGADGLTMVTHVEQENHHAKAAKKYKPKTTLLGLKSHSLLPQTKPVLCVAVSPEYVVTGGEDCTCRVYLLTAALQKQVGPLCELSIHTGAVTSCTFSSDASRLATSSRDMNVHIWNSDKFTVKHPSQGCQPVMSLNDCHSDWITDCRWSDIGDTLVTSSNDFNLKVWDVKTGEEKKTMSGHMSSINCIAYSSGCIVSACTDSSVKVWSHKGTEITTLRGHTERVNSCDIYIRKDPPPAIVWPEREVSATKEKRASETKLDEVMVATCSDDGTVRIWKPLQFHEQQCIIGHSDHVLSMATCGSRAILSSSRDSTVRLWSTEAFSPPLSHNAPVTCLATSSHASIMVSASRDGTVKLWRVDDGSHHLLHTKQVDNSPVTSVCFVDKKGQKFIAGSNKGSVYLFTVTPDLKLSAGRCISGKVAQYRVRPVLSLVWNHHNTAATTYFCSITNSSDVTEWDIHSNEPLHSFTLSGDEHDWCTQLKVCEKKSNLIAATSGGNVYEIKTDTKKVKLLISFAGWVTAILPEMDSREENVVADMDGCVIACTGDNDPDKCAKTHGRAITCIAEVGDTLVTASHDATIKLWSAGADQVGLMPCEAPVTAMAPNPHSNGVVYGDQNGNIYSLSWDPNNGNCDSDS